MFLKPQDTLLAVKYWSLKERNQESSVRSISETTGISVSEISKGAKRLKAARLLVERDRKLFIESKALFEWLGYGVRYAYANESTGYGRGMETSWNCPLLESEMVPPSPPIVWPVSGGNTEGAFIKPIHEAVPFAAKHDDQLYQMMSLIESIRMGKPRELEIARNLLLELLGRK